MNDRRAAATASTRPTRNAFARVFTAGPAAILLTVTGLIGFRPPGHINLVDVPWRRGVWTGGVIWDQLGVGVVLLTVAVIQICKINQRLLRTDAPQEQR